MLVQQCFRFYKGSCNKICIRQMVWSITSTIQHQILKVLVKIKLLIFYNIVYSKSYSIPYILLSQSLNKCTFVVVPTREVLVLLSLPFIVLARGFFTRLVAMFVQLELRLILLLYPYTQVGMPHHNNIKINNARALDLTRLIDRTSPRVWMQLWENRLRCYIFTLLIIHQLAWLSLLFKFLFVKVQQRIKARNIDYTREPVFVCSLNLGRLNGHDECFRLYLSPWKEDVVKTGQILNPKHLSCRSLNLRRLDGPNQCFRLYLSPRKEDTSIIENGQILDPKHLSCLFLLIVYGQKYQIYKLKADVDYPASVINGARCS